MSPAEKLALVGILYLNPVTDVFPAFALPMGECEAGILKRPPRDPEEPILGRRQTAPR